MAQSDNTFPNITLENVKQAASRIEKFIQKTPIMSSHSLDQLSGKELYFKCENLQKTGAFKIRGATNAIQILSDEHASKGVVTHSSGNHGNALSVAAKNRRIPAYIVMPNSAPLVKQHNVSRNGASLVMCEPNMKSREESANKIIKETGAVLIHPFNDLNVIAGQGTIALEILEQVPNVDAIVAPISGGGMISGICVAAKALKPTIQIIGVEPKGADDAYQSKKQGKIVALTETHTCADGLRANSLGSLTWPIIRDLVDQIVTVTEEEIKAATRLVFERMKLVVEPSGAVTLAAVLTEEFKKKKDVHRVAIVLSGGNIDLDEWKW